MSRAASIERLFRAFDRSSDSERARIYLDAMDRESEMTVDAAVTRVMRQWTRVSLPPIGVLLQACEQIRREDFEHAAARRKTEERVPITPAQRAVDREHWRLMGRLFDAGFQWCDVRHRWMRADQAQELADSDARYKAPDLDDTRMALAQLDAGELGEGCPKLIAFRAGMRAARERREKQERRKPRMQRVRDARDAMTPLSEALAEVFN